MSSSELTPKKEISPTKSGNEEVSSGLRPLRLWPAIILLVVMWLAKNAPAFSSDVTMTTFMIFFMGPLVCVLGVCLWWTFASRATVREKLMAIGVLLCVAFAANSVSDKSIKGIGFLFGLPPAATAFVVALAVVSRVAPRYRTIAGVAAASCFLFYMDLLRNDGIRGDMVANMQWRWNLSAEQRFLAKLPALSSEANGKSAVEWDVSQSSAWPEFRGPRREGHAPNVILSEDWKQDAPKEIWRHPIGPGWSSFCVVGDRLFTQEQRGAQEAVVCYDANTGAEIWSHSDTERFWEAVGGAGPRATPTFHEGKLYTMGASGIVNCLDPAQGKVLWSKDVRNDAQAKPPQWGFSSSPLIVDGLVIVHAAEAGKGDKDSAKVNNSILAYDKQDGTLRWQAASGDHSYSSPQLHVDGDRQYILMLTNSGLVALDTDGKIAWEYDWKFEGYRVVQPLAVSNKSFLVGTGMGTGTRLIEVSPGPDGYQIEEQWTSREIKPYFNDFVSHKGYLYGFDHDVFTCVDLASGKRTWKKGRYGAGQVLLLPEGDQLLVLSELGDLVLLRAAPQKHEELSRIKVFTGKTWNHPVLVGNRLYLRNDEEAACYEMKLQKGT